MHTTDNDTPSATNHIQYYNARNVIVVYLCNVRSYRLARTTLKSRDLCSQKTYFDCKMKLYTFYHDSY